MKWNYKCKKCGHEFEADDDCCGRNTKIVCSACGSGKVEEVRIKNGEDVRRILSRFMSYGGG